MAHRAIAAHRVSNDIDTVLKGLDFAGFEGNGSVEDEEQLLNHLVRTKTIAERTPIAVAGYQNPADLVDMLGYVIQHWDTANREEALNNAAAEEERLMRVGAISIDEDTHALCGLREKKAGFFSHIRDLNANAALTPETRDLKHAVQSGLLAKKLHNRRSAIAKMRKVRVKPTITATSDTTPEGLSPEQPEEKTITQVSATTADMLQGLGSTPEHETTINYVLQGLPLVENTTSEPSVKEYFEGVRSAISSSPAEYFDTPEDAQIAVAALGYIIANYNNSATRNHALNLLEGAHISEDRYEQFLLGLAGLSDCMGLAGKGKVKEKLKKAVKKVATATKKVAQKTGKAVKAAAKATGKAVKKVVKTVANVAKKVVKAIIRFNPLSLAAKAGVLIAMRLNMFKMALKLFPAIEPQEAANAGYTPEQIAKAKEKFEKVAKLYADRLMGKRAKLEAAIRKGAKKKWQGSETYSKAEMEQASASLSPQEQVEIDADVEADKQELIAQGAEFDPNGTNADIVTIQKEVEQAVQGLGALGVVVAAAATTAATPVIISIIGLVGGLATFGAALAQRSAAKKESEKAAIEHDTANDIIEANTRATAVQAQSADYANQEWFTSMPEDEKHFINQITADPSYMTTPEGQAFIAEHPELAENEYVNYVANNSVPAAQGLSIGAKVGIAVGTLGALGLLVYALKPKKQPQSLIGL
jgi:hypothetical protein